MPIKQQNIDKFIGFTVTVVVILALGTSALRAVDWKAYGYGMQVTPPRAPSDEVVVVAIDDNSLATYGKWPWNRDLVTNMVRLLSNANASVIGIDIPFESPQNEISLAALRQLKSQYQVQLNDTAHTLLDRVVQKLNTDATLARVQSTADNVILSVPYKTSKSRPDKVPKLPIWLNRHAVKQSEDKQAVIYDHLPEWLHPDQPIYVKNLTLPVKNIGNSAKGLGLGIGRPAIDGSTFARPIVLPYGEHYLPSFALLAVAAKAGAMDKLELRHGKGVSYGDNLIKTDTKFRILPFYYKSKDNLPPFDTYSFSKVLSGEIDPAVFENKIVLIGPTSMELSEFFDTPLNIELPEVLIEAHTIASLLQKDLFQIPAWSYWGRYLAFIIVAVYLIYFLPRLSLGSGLAITSLILVIFINIHFITMTFATAWIPLMGPAVALLLGYMLMSGKHLILSSITQYQSQLSESNRLLGQAYHAQGQFDMAFEKYRLCQANDELLSLTYNLGLDYERKRQFNKAVNVFRFIRLHDPKYRDTKDRVEKNLQTSNTVTLGKPGKDTESTLVIAKDGIQKPMLGRYQIEGELGRGAMGVVYLGNDPKIGRTVAIKTMPLSAEFEEERLEEVKQRFFREAKTAGRLNHYNIVTIYDVGEDQDLAYISMDYLHGVDMSKYAKKENLLKVSDLFNIMIQVTDALNYAHNQNVVHRDIKPANIIYDRRTKKPTITDFGVAHLTDTSKTKTGTILGTPSFMSPEQLAGQTVDGRSDLFSLGVTFFQLLTGQLPFSSESISSLMYKIANEEPEDLLAIRPALPVCVKAIINKTLQKDPDKRFQTGMEFSAALRRCQQNIIAQQIQNSNGRKTPTF